MGKQICVLFDMDGVLLDSEVQYDIIWNRLGKDYRAGIDNFEKVIKGTTLDNILAKYFTHLSEDEVKNLIKDLLDFEAEMDYTREIKGAFDFVWELKKQGIKIGLVTSSNDDKLSFVYKQNDLRQIFDTIVSANRITEGKPNPMCFLLGAKDLDCDPENTFVFEDSFAGLEAGRRAGMKVIALATTHTSEKLEGKADKIINNFTEISIAELLKM